MIRGLAFLLCFLNLSDSAFAGNEVIPECHAHIKPLHIERERVAQMDGIWGLFEKNRALQGNSVIAIDLDKKINSIIFHLQYLCDTLNGIPMNEMARYVRDGINKKGEDGFRRELIVLGKTESEIDIWFEFTRFSLKNIKRALNLKSVLRSIKGSATFFDSYVSLAHKIDRRGVEGSIKADAIKKYVIELSSRMDSFYNTDPNILQAITENARIPYYDINESSGGS